MADPVLSRIHKLQVANQKLAEVRELFDDVWGGQEGTVFRQANSTAFMRLADAVCLVERAGTKLCKAIDLLKKPT